MRWPVLAVDVGGTKTAAALVHPDGTIDNLCLARTQPGGDTADGGDTAESIAVTVIGTARRACAGRPPERIGIACAGPVDPVRGTVQPVNIRAWSAGYPLAAAFEQAFPRAATALVGDAAAAALGEYRFGAGRGAGSLLGIVVSTGVGGGLVFDGNVYQGPGGNAGHIGHLFAGGEFASVHCVCGASGCVEAVASGPSLQRWAQGHGRPGLSPEQLASAAREGDCVAEEAYRRAARALAYAVTQTSLICDLDVVTVGGGVAQAGDVLLEPFAESVAAAPGLAYARRLKVRPTQLKGTAGLLGAALAVA